LVYGEFGLIKNLLFKVFICLLDEHPKKFSLNFMWPFKVQGGSVISGTLSKLHHGIPIRRFK
jgi:hypothetical protein